MSRARLRAAERAGAAAAGEGAVRMLDRYIADDEVAAAIKAHRAYISNETLAVLCVRMTALPNSTELDLNGHACHVRVARA